MKLLSYYSHVLIKYQDKLRIVHKLKASINKRFIIPLKVLLIIHTDIESSFTNQSYFQLTKRYI